jgi:MATE family multidrug resistance protein
MPNADTTIDIARDRTPFSTERWLAKEVKEQARLAWPIFFGQIAAVGIAFSDVAMSGSIGTKTLAGVAVGSSVFIIVMFGLAGFFYGVNPIVSQLFGARKSGEISSFVRQALWLAVAAGGAGFCVCFASSLLIHYMGLEREVQDVAVSFLMIIGLACPAYCGFRVLHGYSSSLGHTKPMMLISFASLFVNVALNWILIYGHLGFPALGGVGCAFATTTTMWVNLALMIAVVKKSDIYRTTSPFSRFEGPSWEGARELVKVGSPIAVSFLVEGATFAGIGLLVSPMGTVQVAAHQVALNFNSLILMIPSSMAVAITTRVGQAIGEASLDEAKRRGIVGVTACLGVGLAVSLLAVLFGKRISEIYTSDAKTIVVTTTLFGIVAVMHIFDVLQSAFSALIRAYKETDVAMYVQTGAFWGLALPLGCVLGLAPAWLPISPSTPMGARGFWLGLTVGLAVGAIALGILAKRITEEAIASQAGTDGNPR